MFACVLVYHSMSIEVNKTSSREAFFSHHVDLQDQTKLFRLGKHRHPLSCLSDSINTHISSSLASWLWHTLLPVSTYSPSSFCCHFFICITPIQFCFSSHRCSNISSSYFLILHYSFIHSTTSRGLCLISCWVLGASQPFA